MISVLNIAQKNSVAKQIAKHLSRESFTYGRTLSKYNPIFEFQIPQQRYNMKVSSVRGHLIEYNFPKVYKSWSKHNPRIFFKDVDCIVQPGEDMEELMENLRMLARGVQLLVLWLDCDREGEAIAFEVIDVIRKVVPGVAIKRARFSAVTQTDVWNAFRNLVEPNKYESDAVNYRQEVDLRLGVAFTIFQSLTLQNSVGVSGTVSYGPCQFPTLGFVVDRYLKVKNFIPEKYWMIKAYYLNETNNERIEFKWNRQRLFCQLSTTILFSNIFESSPDLIPVARIVSENKSSKKKYKPWPLSTIELQKLGTKKLNMTAKQVMDVAEKLYQKGFISYPRTETTVYPPTMNMMSFVRLFQSGGNYEDYASKLVNESKYSAPRNGNKNDQAHPPIHPVKSTGRGSFTDQEWKVYDLICRHFLGSCSKDAEGEEKIICVEIAEETFRACHLEITAYNYLEIYTFERWTQSTIPSIPQTFTPLLEITSSETSPPGYLTESDLIGLMDKNQIGTDSTIHQHINTIQQRQYAVKTNNTLKPTPLGLALVQSYNTMGIQLSNCSVRRNIEINMNQIAHRRLTKSQAIDMTINQMLPIFDKLVQKRSQWISLMKTHLPNDGTKTSVFNDDLFCHVCNSKLRNKDGKLWCNTCGYSLEYPPGNYSKTDFKCPICQFTVVEVIKRAKKYPDTLCLICYNGTDDKKYLQCQNCTYTCPKAKGSTRKDVFQCPSCPNKTSLKIAKNGNRFAGCNSYPDCKESRWFHKFVKNIVVLEQKCERCEEDSMCSVSVDERMVDDVGLLIRLTEKGEEGLVICINPMCSHVLYEDQRQGGGNYSSNLSTQSSGGKHVSQPKVSVKCYRCQQTGHYANDCPSTSQQPKGTRPNPSPPRHNKPQIPKSNIMDKWLKKKDEDQPKPKNKKWNKHSESTDNAPKPNKGEFQSLNNSKYTCFKCNEVGHIAPNCPNNQNKGKKKSPPKGRKKKQ